MTPMPHQPIFLQAEQILLNIVLITQEYCECTATLKVWENFRQTEYQSCQK